MNERMQSWEHLIVRHNEEPKFKSRTCSIFNINSSFPAEPDKLCPCDRMVRRHSLVGDCLQSKAAANGNLSWEPPVKFLDNGSHSTKVPVNVYGTLNSDGCKFLRIDCRVPVKDLYQLILEDCAMQKPALIISVYGGAKYFTMPERLEKEFIRGVIDAATMTDAWILTAGVNNGVSKLVGEGISHYRLLREYSNKVKCIGMTMWGTISENTRLELKNLSRGYPRPLCQRQIPESAQEDKETIEPNHTHCFLFDSGRLHEYLCDTQRHQFVTEACRDDDNHACYPVTIIVEGGLGTLEVLESDIDRERPIVLIQGSGRLADVLAFLVEQTSNPDHTQDWEPSKQEIEQALDRFYPNTPYSEVSSAIKRIQEVLKVEYRHLLHVFSLDRDKNVAETIFKAIFMARNKKKSVGTDKKHETELLDHEKQRRNSEDKLVDLAVEWNYFDGVLPILQARQGEMVKKKHDFMTADIARQKVLFLKSLEKNRPAFVEYFLSAGFEPLTLAEKDDIYSYQTVILNLYNKTYEAMSTSQKNRVMIIFGVFPLESIKQLDYKLNKLIGSFFGSIYSTKDDSFTNRIKIDLSNRVCTCCGSFGDTETLPSVHIREQIKQIQTKYTKHHMLRDLFLWSVLMDMPEMAKVLLLRVRSRICAALIASAIFRKYAASSHSVDMTDKFQTQALEFETYAAASLDKCYECNDERACELLLRQLPLFGNITCMQIAISSQGGKLLETACFDQALNHVWCDKLGLTNRQASARLSQVPSVLSLGLLAPWLITYRREEKYLMNDKRNEELSQEGINYYTDEQKLVGQCSHYWTRFRYFHECPMIKMVYHFLSYIWFILVFSYMMLYQLDSLSGGEVPHWTEIYVIITVSTMFFEEIRKIYYEYDTRMIERWGSTGSTILTVLSNVFYITPYFLFYAGLGFRYGSYKADLLSTARIIWALDLELWYIRSLKFVMALKFLGPKLFMLKNMLRDLFAFVYMIFIAVAAYGVVSRSLIFYKEVPFTARDIFSNVFYEPYWFIYGAVSDKELLDNRTSTDAGKANAEATATHVLLAFHMLFINILLLNLLVAVFADSIVKVQENTEFYWRYQRYSFVREYFERSPLSYPPLIIIPHFILLVLAIRRACCSPFNRNKIKPGQQPLGVTRITPIFKMIPNEDSQNERWDLFENAATHGYARSALEKDKNKDGSNIDDDKPRRTMATTNESTTAKSTTDQQQTIGQFREEIMSVVKSVVTESQKNFEQSNTRLESRLDQLSVSLERLMDRIEHPKPTDQSRFKTSVEQAVFGGDARFANQSSPVTKRRYEY